MDSKKSLSLTGKATVVALRFKEVCLLAFECYGQLASETHNVMNFAITGTCIMETGHRLHSLTTQMLYTVRFTGSTTECSIPETQLQLHIQPSERVQDVEGS